MSTAMASMQWLRMERGDLLTYGPRGAGAAFASIMRAGGGSRFPSRGCQNPQGETTMTLTDRVAIVTGAGNGIGSATALALARAGADLVVVDIDKAAAEKTAADVVALGRRSL